MSDNNKITFTEGKEVSVWKTTGVKAGKTGPTSSERTGQTYPDLEPSEKLIVKKKYGSSKALCTRPDRLGEEDEEVLVHINHVNPASSYYANRGTKSAPKTSAEKLAATKAKAEAALKDLEAAKAEAEAATASQTDPATLEADQAEAAALFEAANS